MEEPPGSRRPLMGVVIGEGGEPRAVDDEAQTLVAEESPIPDSPMWDADTRTSGDTKMSISSIFSSKSFSGESARVVCTVMSAYLLVSVAIVFFYRYVFLYQCPYVLCATWLQQLVNAIAFLGSSLIHLRNPERSPWFIPTPKKFFSLISVAITYCGMTMFVNLCLSNTPSATFHVARSFTLPLTMVFSYWAFHHGQSPNVIGAASMITGAFFVTYADERALSPVGAQQGASSCFFQAMHYVLLRRQSSKAHDDNLVQFCNATLSLALLLPCIWLWGEWEIFKRMLTWNGTDNDFFWVQFWALSTAFGAFAMTWASYMAVRYTSPIAFNLMGVTKSALQSILGFATGDPFSIMALLGVLLKIGGSTFFIYLREKEKRVASKESNMLDQFSEDMDYGKSDEDQFVDSDEEQGQISERDPISPKNKEYT
eukprot:Selendium_serpulae@DN11128_c0_g1_i1.p1